MARTDFHLTETETACGVRIEQVAAAAASAYILSDGDRVVVSGKLGPAIEGAAARMKLGAEVEFLGLNPVGQSIYRRANL